MNQLTATRKKVFTLSHYLYNKAEGRLNQSQALRTAWAIVKKEGSNLVLITWEKVSGELNTRVLAKNWIDYNEIKGTGKAVAPRKIYTDVGKQFLGMSSTVSLYPDRIKLAI